MHGGEVVRTFTVEWSTTEGQVLVPDPVLFKFTNTLHSVLLQWNNLICLHTVDQREKLYTGTQTSYLL